MASELQHFINTLCVSICDESKTPERENLVIIGTTCFFKALVSIQVWDYEIVRLWDGEEWKQQCMGDGSEIAGESVAVWCIVVQCEVWCGVWPWWQRMSLCDVPIRSAVTACSGPAEQSCAVPCITLQWCAEMFEMVSCGPLRLTETQCGSVWCPAGPSWDGIATLHVFTMCRLV